MGHIGRCCFPPHWLRDFAREPLPKRVIWDLNTRAPLRQTESFYYLSAPYTAAGTQKVNLCENNRVEIDLSGFDGEFSVYFNEDMIDFAKPVTFALSDGETQWEAERTLVPDLELLRQTTAERGDPNYQFEAKVLLSELLAE